MQIGSYFRRVSADYGRFSQWTISEDLVTAELAQLRQFAEQNRAVVDVGAGTGQFLQRVAEELVYPGAQLIALDLSVEMLMRHANYPAAGDRSAPRIIRLRADVRHLPFLHRSIDRVIGRQILHYVDPMVAVGEIARVLPAGGIFHSTQQVDYDDVPDDWYTEWSALRDAPTRRRLSNHHLDCAVAEAGLVEVSRRDVPVLLEYTWPELAHKYGRRHGEEEQIIEFFRDSPAPIKSQFGMRLDASGVRYHSRFRVSAFQKPWSQHDRAREA